MLIHRVGAIFNQEGMIVIANREMMIGTHMFILGVTIKGVMMLGTTKGIVMKASNAIR